MRADDQNRKKKTQKRGSKVPLQQLGFKAKIYYGIETEYRRQRVRYKAVKYGVQNSRECFMGRLRFTLNTAELENQQLQNLASFKGIRKSEWNKVRQIVYHSKQELSCSICLQKQFQAPQMTSCGHVFCWHCILMHFYKSLKACFCPVCNEAYEINHVVSCQPFYTKAFKEMQSNRVCFALKARREGDSRVYDPETLQEDLTFARIVRATPEKMLDFFQKQRQQIEDNISRCEDEQIKKWIQKVHSLSWERIEKAQALTQKKQTHHSHHHRQNHLSKGQIQSVLDEKQRPHLVNFYQQKSGRLIFLHPICDKFIRKAYPSGLPKIIEEEIVYWQEAEYNIQMLKKYKQISHTTINQELDLVIINIEKLIPEDDVKEFQEELERFNTRKQDQRARQEREAERLSVEYEEHKQYMAKLKKMEESEFYDIKVPSPLDITQLSSASLFPSLIETQSAPTEQDKQSSVETPPPGKAKKTKKVLNEGDFPDLLIKKQSSPTPQLQHFTPLTTPQNLASTKSEQVSFQKGSQQNDFPSLGGAKAIGSQAVRRNKKKKEKFVNVTDMFFRQDEEEEY